MLPDMFVKTAGFEIEAIYVLNISESSEHYVSAPYQLRSFTSVQDSSSRLQLLL
jgi:hypothetical protein